ncbi:unnamed protein product, partial [Meganyctiphanes norvegica]
SAIILLEMITSVAVVSTKDAIYDDLKSSLAKSMNVSMDKYTDNSSDTQIWDVIQTNQKCCGIRGYDDWALSGYGDGNDVPESCCQLNIDGCGRGVVEMSDPWNVIFANGCLEVVLTGMKRVVGYLACAIWIPVIIIQGILRVLVCKCI